jgi:prepilin-type N-terminal cleavage/methylation domain-containing protein
MKHKKGFTFIELIIVIALIGIIGSFFLLTFPSAQKKGRDTQRRSDLKQYQAVLERYANSNSSVYPAGSGFMVTYCGVLKTGACPDDPKGNPYEYVATASSLSYYIFAALEMPDTSGNTLYFVVCSNGTTGETDISPSGTNCPI